MWLCVCPVTWHKLNMKFSWQKNCPVQSFHNTSDSFCCNTNADRLSWFVSKYRSQSKGGISLVSRDICMTSPVAKIHFRVLSLPPFLTLPPNPSSKLVMYNSIHFEFILFNQTFTDCFCIKSIPCLKHLWGYVIASEENLAEQKSLCVERDLCTAVLVHIIWGKGSSRSSIIRNFFAFRLLLVGFLLGLRFHPEDEGTISPKYLSNSTRKHGVTS